MFVNSCNMPFLGDSETNTLVLLLLLFCWPLFHCAIFSCSKLLLWVCWEQSSSNPHTELRPHERGSVSPATRKRDTSPVCVAFSFLSVLSSTTWTRFVALNVQESCFRRGYPLRTHRQCSSARRKLNPFRLPISSSSWLFPFALDKGFYVWLWLCHSVSFSTPSFLCFALTYFLWYFENNFKNVMLIQCMSPFVHVVRPHDSVHVVFIPDESWGIYLSRKWTVRQTDLHVLVILRQFPNCSVVVDTNWRNLFLFLCGNRNHTHHVNSCCRRWQRRRGSKVRKGHRREACQSEAHGHRYPSRVCCSLVGVRNIELQKDCWPRTNPSVSSNVKFSPADSLVVFSVNVHVNECTRASLIVMQFVVSPAWRTPTDLTCNCLTFGACKQETKGQSFVQNDLGFHNLLLLCWADNFSSIPVAYVSSLPFHKETALSVVWHSSLVRLENLSQQQVRTIRQKTNTTNRTKGRHRANPARLRLEEAEQVPLQRTRRRQPRTRKVRTLLQQRPKRRQHTRKSNPNLRLKRRKKQILQKGKANKWKRNRAKSLGRVATRVRKARVRRARVQREATKRMTERTKSKGLPGIQKRKPKRLRKLQEPKQTARKNPKTKVKWKRKKRQRNQKRRKNTLIRKTKRKHLLTRRTTQKRRERERSQKRVKVESPGQALSRLIPAAPSSRLSLDPAAAAQVELIFVAVFKTARKSRLDNCTNAQMQFSSDCTWLTDWSSLTRLQLHLQPRETTQWHRVQKTPIGSTAGHVHIFRRARSCFSLKNCAQLQLTSSPFLSSCGLYDECNFSNRLVFQSFYIQIHTTMHTSLHFPFRQLFKLCQREHKTCSQK